MNVTSRVHGRARLRPSGSARLPPRGEQARLAESLAARGSRGTRPLGESLALPGSGEHCTRPLGRSPALPGSFRGSITVPPRRRFQMDRSAAETDSRAHKASTRSLRSLDVLNFFLADVRDGMGPFLGTFLREVRHWDAGQVGIAWRPRRSARCWPRRRRGRSPDHGKRLAIGSGGGGRRRIVLYLVPSPGW